MAGPCDSHWSAVKHMMHYLNSMVTHGLVLAHVTPQQQMSLCAYCDSNWASYPDDRRSTSGLYVYLGLQLVA